MSSSSDDIRLYHLAKKSPVHDVTKEITDERDGSTGQISDFEIASNGDLISAKTTNSNRSNWFKSVFTVKHEHRVHRKLKTRHIQLIAIGGAIGTAVFISIGGGLIKGGPLGLLLAYILWSAVMFLVISAVGEMVSYLPIPSPFITMSGRTVDKALEFTFGWNIFIMESLYIPFEIVAVNGMIHYWRSDYSPAITFCVQIFIYSVINLFAVGLFGETEFWLSLGKLILVIGLLFFTFITMVGGNPSHDIYGFRNWHVEGGPIAQYIHTGDLGRFQGFIGALIQSAFTIIGPEYMSMAAGETINPRKSLPIAFRSVFARLVIFYVGGALSVGILVAYNDSNFVAKYGASSNASASPYVVAMDNMGIKVLPHIINAIIITSAFSAGNSFVFCSSRVLYGLAKQGYAPKVFALCNSSGVPVFCIVIAMCFALLSLLQLGDTASTVLDWIVSICTGSQVLNYVYMGITYIRFHKACKAQNIDRNGFAYKSWFQPYSAYISLFFLICMVGILGYTNFMPGRWSTSSFIFNYIMVFVNAILFLFWKLFKGTKFIKPEEADLYTGLEEIEQHEYEYYSGKDIDKDDDKDKLLDKILQWIL